MEQFVIYEKPTDYPDKFVVRRWEITSEGADPKEVVDICDSLQEARDSILAHHPGFHRVPRDRDDNSVIVETWT